MHCRYGECGVHGLGEGIFEEAQVYHPKYAYVVRVKLDMDNLLVVGSRNGDGGGEPYFDRCIDGGHHCVCLGVSQGDDKVGKL